jgi:hypothetical protein
VQDRVQRPVLEREHAAAPLLDIERDLVAVHGRVSDGGEDEQLVHRLDELLRIERRVIHVAGL